MDSAVIERDAELCSVGGVARFRNTSAELNCTNRETLRATKCRRTLADLEQRGCDLDPDLDGESGSPPAGGRTPSQAQQLRQTLADLEQRGCDLDPDLDGASGSPPAGRRTPSQAQQLSEPWSPHL